ncbi:MAG: pentapeptide repeat-containing protein [Phormidesmis priestleyi]|uniref:Pentapeptide repeat-containing protein n=1 Tax=Phormidesmis priestleyi TaxID=268141 RepID=A0A2W4WU74_9CYAN|nr:MAG: pentapeptide repeat-containing protein [Phormidesmis priestleyi]
MGTYMTAEELLQQYRLGERDFRGIKLKGIFLRDQCLRDIDLSCADLRGASLMGVDFRGANLRRADFTGAFLILAQLNQADLTQANLTNAFLILANLQQCCLAQANLTQANLTRANLSRVSGLTEGLLHGAVLASANLPQKMRMSTLDAVSKKLSDRVISSFLYATKPSKRAFANKKLSQLLVERASAKDIA